jgi:cytochrome c
MELAALRAAVIRAALAGLQPVGAAGAAGGDATRGERVFQRCFACHSVDPKETAKLQGPSLFGVVGRPAASVAGFEYSDAMKAKGAAGLVWTTEALDRYIADPEGFVPGTLMSLPPLRNEQERADLIAYLLSRRRAAYFGCGIASGVDVAGPSPQTRMVACSSLAPSKCTPLA